MQSRWARTFPRFSRHKLAANSLRVNRREEAWGLRRLDSSVESCTSFLSPPRPTSAPSSNVITNHLPHASRELPKLTSIESASRRAGERACLLWRRVERIRVEERRKEGSRGNFSRVPTLLLFLPLLPSRKLRRQYEKLIVLAAESKRWKANFEAPSDNIPIGQRDRGRNWPDFPSMRRVDASPRDGADEETWLYRLLHSRRGAAAAGPIRGSVIRVAFPLSPFDFSRYSLDSPPATVFLFSPAKFDPSMHRSSSPSPTLQELESVFA